MSRFRMRIDNVILQIEFVSQSAPIAGEAYYTGEAYFETDENAPAEKDNLVFRFSFIKDTDSDSVGSFRVDTHSKELQALVEEKLTDQIILGIEGVEQELLQRN